MNLHVIFADGTDGNAVNAISKVTMRTAVYLRQFTYLGSNDLPTGVMPVP